jgi:hypothetical protein
MTKRYQVFDYSNRAPCEYVEACNATAARNLYATAHALPLKDVGVELPRFKVTDEQLTKYGA